MRYFWWNTAELFPGKRFFPLNVGENSASYPSSLRKHWFTEVYQETGKMPFLSLLFQFLTEKNILATSQAGSYSDQSQKSGLLCQDHYFKPVPGALYHLCLEQGNGNPLPFLHSQGALYLPLPPLLPFSHWIVCVSRLVVPSVKGRSKFKTLGRLVSQCEKGNTGETGVPHITIAEGKVFLAAQSECLDVC